MPTLIPEGYSHVIQPYTHGSAGKRFSITYGVWHGAPVNPNLEEFVTELDTAFRAAWRPLTDSSFTFQPAEMYSRLGPAITVLSQSTLVAQAGGTAKNSPPPQVAVCIRKRTNFVGRDQRGRCYFPGLLDETAVDEAGVLQTTAVAAFQTAATNWLNAITSAGAEGMYLLHGKTLDAPSKVTNLLVQPIVRTQRRRLPRG